MKKVLSLIIAAIMCITVFPCFAEAQFESEKLNALHYVENAIIAQPFEQVQTLHCVLGVEDGVNIMYTTSSSKPATFNVVDLDNMKLLRSFSLMGTASAWEHIIDKEGNVYIITTDKSRLFRYSPKTKEVTDLGSINAQAAAYQSCFDDEGNLYIGTYSSGSVIKFDPKTGKFTDFGTVREGNPYIRSLSFKNGYLWAGSNGTGNAVMVRIDPKTGDKKEIAVPIMEDKYTEVTNIYSQTHMDDRYILTYGANGKGNNCWMVFDSVEEKYAELCVTNGGGGIYGLGTIDGKTYFGTKNGTKAIDHKTLEITDTPAKTVTGRGGGIIDFPEGKYEGFGKNTIVTVNTTGNPIFINVESGKVKSFTDAQLKGGYLSLQHVVAGPGNTIYSGAYLGSRSMIYEPDTGRESYIPMGQTENIKMIGGKMYFGVYPEGVVKVYDPATPEVAPKTIIEIKNDQDRPYIIDGNEDYIIAGSIATYGKLGGALTIYDKKTGKYEVIKNIVQDHSVVGLAIKNNIIYGSTTVSGGLGIDYTEQYGKIFVYDMEKKEKIKEFIPEWPKEMTAAGDGVKIIGDLEFGPDGLLWGASQGYIFAMNPDTMEIVKSKIVGTFNYSGTGHYWMPRHIRFDKDGLLYVTSDYGVVLDPETMEYLSLKPWSKNKSNIADIDEDGNWYFGLVGTLRKVARTGVEVTSEDKEKLYSSLKNSVALAIGTENAISKNEIQRIDPENTMVRPVIKNGRTLLPVRFVAESLNAEVSWNNETRTATLKSGSITIDVPIGKKEIYINGEAKETDVPAEIENGRTLLPLRALAEALNKKVFWDDMGLIVVSDSEFTPSEAETEKLYWYIKAYGNYEYAEKMENLRIAEEIKNQGSVAGQTLLNVPNASFNEGEGKGLVSWEPLYKTIPEGMTLEISKGKGYGDKTSLHIIDTNNAGDMGAYSNPVPVTAGEKYMLNTQLFIESGRTSVTLRFYDEGLNQLASFSENVQTGQGAWQDIAVSGEAPKDAAYARILLSCSQLWITDAYYDNVRLYQLR